MNRWVIMGCAIGALLLGFYFGQKSKPNAVGNSQNAVMAPPPSLVEIRKEAPPIPTSASTISKVDGAKPFQIPPSPEIERRIKSLTPEVRALIEKNKLMNYFRRLAPQFSEDESGQDLLLMTTFLELHEMAGTAESKLVDVKMKALESNPDEAMLAMGMAMQRMGHKFPDEKQYLLQFVNKLDVPLEDKTELLVAEAKRPFDEQELSGQARFNPSIALYVLGNIHQGKEKYLYPILREIVAAHKDHPEIQKIVIHEYGRFDSARSQQLYKELGFNR